MKIVRRDFIRDGPGSVKMVPIDPEDLWCVYNLIAPGDSVMAATVRKVLREAASGGRDAERVKVKLEIVVENVDYDKVGSILRIRGKNILENEYVKIGAFHTLELELHRPFVLRKEVWDTMARDILQQAADPTASADVAVVLMHEGLAHILLVGKSVTTTRARIETSIPRKHGPAVAGYEKALNKFFNNIMEAFLKHVDFNVIRCAVFASPGFTKDQFHKYLLLEAERKQLRPIIENKSRIVLVHTTSGFKHSLKEVLEAPDVMNVIKDTKAAQEVRVLKEFFDMLSNDQTRACYGPKHVEVAHERMAVQTLLITDELFRSSDVTTRKKYVNLVESVKDSGGKVHVFSSMHVSGELSQEIRQESALHHYARGRLLQRIKTHQGFYRLISNSHNLVLIIFSSSPEQDRTGNFDTEFPMSILFKVSSFLSTANEDIIISFMELKFERSTDEYSIALCSSQDTLEFLLPCFEILLPWFLLSVITALTLPFSCAFNISLRIV